MAEVRICEFCGHQNPMSAMACEECGADLAFVQPTEISDTSTSNRVWTLISKKTGQEFPITTSVEVGRLNSDLASLLNESDYTSRHHANLEVTPDGLSVTDESSNGTSINGVKIEKGKPSELCDGDELSFADIVFTVKCNADAN